MSGLAQVWAEFAARRFLARLTDQFGAAGLAAAAAVPGLQSAVDQHSAAVRDIVLVGLDDDDLASAFILLTAYAHGILDEATERGWQLCAPEDLTEWAEADWTAIRLLAICTLGASLRACQGAAV